MAGGASEGDDVCMGENSRTVSRAGFGGVFQEAVAGGEGRGESGHRLWWAWGWARAFLFDRERGADAAGPARHQADVQERLVILGVF